MLGDFNAFDRETPDRNNSPSTCSTIDILKDIDPARKGNELMSVAALIPKERRYSDWVDWDQNGVVDSTELSMLDYILISRTIAKQIKKAGVLSQGYDPRKTADHFPVWVELDLRGR
jgi:exonuclease III